MPKRIAIIQGHPDPRGQHFGHALADSYTAGARGGSISCGRSGGKAAERFEHGTAVMAVAALVRARVSNRPASAAIFN